MRITSRYAIGIAAGALCAGLAWFSLAHAEHKSGGASGPPEQKGEPVLELNDKQVAAIRIDQLGEHSFAVEREAVGAVDFNEDMSVQVYPHYQGRIIETFAKLGDDVKKGQTLYTIHSPDLVQAEGTLIATAATRELTTKVLARARSLFGDHGIAQKDLDQAISDQQSAEGAFKAARDAVLVFGKSAGEIDRIVADRKVDPALVVPSPVSGRVTARNAQPGMFVQPGNGTAPYNVADLSVIWLVANVAESDSPALKIGQKIKARVMAYPGRVFTGTLARIGTSVDPNVHTVIARAEIEDPRHELRPGMIAAFRVETADPQLSPALPVNGVVREGDGTMTAWITADRHHFQRRIIKVGLQQDGLRQVLEGVQANDQVVVDGAILLSNMTAGSPPTN